MESYESNLPIGEFKFPMDAMTHKAGTTNMNYEGLLEHLQTKPYWYIARIYKTNHGELRHAHQVELCREGSPICARVRPANG